MERGSNSKLLFPIHSLGSAWPQSLLRCWVTVLMALLRFHRRSCMRASCLVRAQMEAALVNRDTLQSCSDLRRRTLVPQVSDHEPFD